MIRWINLIEEEILFVIAVINGVGFFALVYGNEYLGMFVAVPLIGLSLMVTVIIYKRLYGSKKKTKGVAKNKLSSIIPKDKVLSKSNKNL